MATDLHGFLPLSVLAGTVFVVPLERVALVAEVLDDCALAEPATRSRVTGVAAVLWLTGRLAIWRGKDRKYGIQLELVCRET